MLKRITIFHNSVLTIVRFQSKWAIKNKSAISKKTFFHDYIVRNIMKDKILVLGNSFANMQ